MDAYAMEYHRLSITRADNCPNFCTRELMEWCKTQEIILHSIQVGTPIRNGCINKFNKTYR